MAVVFIPQYSDLFGDVISLKVEFEGDEWTCGRIDSSAAAFSAFYQISEVLPPHEARRVLSQSLLPEELLAHIEKADATVGPVVAVQDKVRGQANCAPWLAWMHTDNATHYMKFMLPAQLLVKVVQAAAHTQRTQRIREREQRQLKQYEQQAQEYAEQRAEAARVAAQDIVGSCEWAGSCGSAGANVASAAESKEKGSIKTGVSAAPAVVPAPTITRIFSYAAAAALPKTAPAAAAVPPAK